MKTIGFVDYYLSEWHANNYVGWIDECNKELGTDYKVAYAWAETHVSPKNGETTAQWCEKYGVTPCETIDELCEKADVILILAPSDPHKHLPYAKKVFPYGKRVYVDKTFAPDLETAKEIFALAAQYNTPFFSTSALRYAEELKDCQNVQNLLLTGGGGSAEEYIVHQAENAIRLLGTGNKLVVAYNQGNQIVFQVDCENGKKATLTYAPPLPFTACWAAEGEKDQYKALKSDYFHCLICDILRFYESGKPSFDGTETLAVMALRDALLEAASNPWLEVPTKSI
ncbi:MAG: Gfo/Idh/MocA family oxidoreductase [Clostridia bacterium]|nr:Gfo/Idh/MocA family oxidoreductase [Clostridia bacterium]